MREFELLPNEAEIINMAREFNNVQVRHEILKGHCTKNTPKCGNTVSQFTIDTLIKCYRNLCDMETATRKLFSAAPTAVRPQIRRIASLKKYDVEYTQKLIAELTSGGVDLSYAPDLKYPDSFCALLDALICEQDELLHLLAKLETNTGKLVHNELICLEGYNRLLIYCAMNNNRFNNFNRH